MLWLDSGRLLAHTCDTSSVTPLKRPVWLAWGYTTYLFAHGGSGGKGVIANVFYLDMGHSKEMIATATKTFGIWPTIFGGFLGGWLRCDSTSLRILMLGAVLCGAGACLTQGPTAPLPVRGVNHTAFLAASIPAPGVVACACGRGVKHY